MSELADRVLAGLGDTFRKQAGALLAPVVESFVGPAVAMDQMLEPTEEGWARIFDATETPSPAMLGAATGTPIPSGLTLEQQRAYLLEQPGRRRGSAASIIAAARAAAPGRQVDLFERLGSPWNLQVRLTGGGDTTETNLAPDPRTPDFSANDVIWTTTGPVAITGHPLGFTQGTEIRRTVGQTSLASASVFNLDELGNYGTSRYLGAWVKVNVESNVTIWASADFAGTIVGQIVPANVWTWVRTPGKGTGYAILEAYPTRGSVLDSDRVWVSGVRSSTTPADFYFDGDTTDTLGVNFAWTGTPENSSSTRTTDTAAVVRAAVERQKPVGITLDVVVVAGATFDHMRIHHGPTFADQAAAFGTFDDERTHIPEGGTTP